MTTREGSLEAPTSNDWLTRARDSDDVLALKALSEMPEIRDKLRSPQAVRLLWDVCRIPDFRSISEGEHAGLLARIFGFLADNGQVPTDWLATNVAGAGAYSLKSWDRGAQMTITRNPDYYKGFGNGPIDGIAQHNDHDTKPALQLGAGYTKQADVSQVGLRALYTMGALTVGGYLQRESVDGSANGKSRDIVRLVAMYAMGANEFHVNVGHSDRGGSFAQKASQYTLGFNHNLTKRTKLYTYYTAINSPGKANDFNAIAVGMRHNF